MIDDPSDDPDAPPSEAELAAATRLGTLLAGGARLPAGPMSADERTLLELAGEVRAARGAPLPLPTANASALVDRALAEAVRAPILDSAMAVLEARTTMRRRRPLWAAAGALAVAALTLLWLVPSTPRPTGAPPSATWQLRSPDEIVGQIAPEDAGNAAARLSLLHADRLAGLRAARLGGRP